MVVSLTSTYVVFAMGGIYRASRTRFLHEEVSRLLLCWVAVCLTVGLFAFLSKIAVDVSRLWFGASMLLAISALVLSRIATTLLLATSHARGYRVRSVIVIGNNATSARLIDLIDEDPRFGIRVVAVFDHRTYPDALPPARHPVIGDMATLAPFIEHHRKHAAPISQVWITLPMDEIIAMQADIDGLKNSSVDVCIVPDLFALQLIAGSMTQVGEVPIVNTSDIRLRGTAERFKSVFDMILASIAVVMLAPLMALIALAIVLESPGPVLFRQHRYGMNGREILVWKFRSMVVQEDGENVRQAQRNDARVTRVGALLRRTSMDELPQFFNVLQGHMSIVGPRPHAVLHNEQYRHRIEGYMMRHKIKPGITGWAQVNGWRGETDTLEKMEQRVQYDLEYIRNWSAWLDIKIMLLTLVRGLMGKSVY